MVKFLILLILIPMFYIQVQGYIEVGRIPLSFKEWAIMLSLLTTVCATLYFYFSSSDSQEE